MRVIEAVHGLEVPTESLVVVGSEAVRAAGVDLYRDLDDYDAVASEETFAKLAFRPGWLLGRHGNGEPRLTNGKWDVSMSWTVGDKQQPVKELMDDPNAIQIQGVIFAGLEKIVEMKEYLDRPKDRADLQVIRNSLILPEALAA
jgi:hypothetical protein